MRLLSMLTIVFLMTVSLLHSDEERDAPAPNRANEPIAPFSAQKAAQFLDSASLHWQKTNQCFTCHTNYAYLIARPYLGKDAPALRQVREFAESLIQERWKTKGPRWDAEVVATGSILAINDAATTGKLHPLTRKALDQMWTLQRPDGGWNWLKCEWPPMESDDHYGATLAAVGIGMAPDNYAETPAAQAGMTKLKKYFADHPPKFPHHRGMLLWANARVTDLVSITDKKKWIDELLSLQKADGGWNSATLGTWKRHDGTDQDTETSDGYATGFVVFVLRKTGLPADHRQIQQGVRWLKTHQRDSGRWFARSLFKDNKHYLSHAASAFAVMALAECNALGLESSGVPYETATETTPTLNLLKDWLKLDPQQRPSIQDQPFATKALTASEARSANLLLWEDQKKRVRASNEQEWKNRCIQTDDHALKFDFRVFGEKPKTGRSLVISLHGGGSSPKAVNDQQWENQKRLYKLDEGVYLAPRAPTDAWNMWHQGHIDQLFERLILDAIVFEDVDPDRVYLTGYSAGGDGVYRLAPRLADHWAAAAMMAGHPGEASPLQLRNLPFAIHVGERDSAYQRNQQAKDWKNRLENLQKGDPQGYVHEVVIHTGKGHWMNREDAVALKWMAQYRRQALPTRIVWQPTGTTRMDFYWLALPETKLKPQAEIIASRQQASVNLQTKGVSSVVIQLNDEMMDLDKPITVNLAGERAFTGKVQRTVAMIHKSLTQRHDPSLVFSSQVVIEIPPSLQ